MKHLSTLSEWVSWVEKIHSTEIELGLERVKTIGNRLQLLHPPCPVITVGGTNGKGSTVGSLEAIYLASGYQAGAFTSPYLFRLNEEIRINGQPVSDEDLCRAFSQIENARSGISLTPFEFYTLAALLIFQERKLDVIILEVGLGGRLDAVNIIDADIAVVTNIDIDHVKFLGGTRELIAVEKAGIFRSQKPAICGDPNPPATLTERAEEIGARLFCQGRDFSYEAGKADWSWHSQHKQYSALPYNSLLLQNMSTALMAVSLLQARLPVADQAVRQGLQNIRLTGRIQTIPGPVPEIYDVSHNPQAVGLLSERLKSTPVAGKTLAVFSMLADKDIQQCVQLISSQIDAWYVAPLRDKRAAAREKLEEIFSQADARSVQFFPSIQDAYDHASGAAQTGDRVVVFGSFHTVADVLRYNNKIREAH